MQQKEVIVRVPLGLHARVAARISTISQRFHSKIVIVANGKRANARSLVAVLILAAGFGSRVYIEASGPDEAEAVKAVAELVEKGFVERG